MNNKKGFISTTVVYSFFFVFLMMLLVILTNYSSSRNLLKTIKNDVKSDISDTNFARYLINHYDELIDDGLLNHDFDLANGANDNSYRFSGSNPNNYVCFGSNETSCPVDNLYRIIGVIDGKVKLIKNTSLLNIVWDDAITNSNIWLESNVYNYLNNDYFNSLGEEYNKLIETTTWYVGGFENEDDATTLIGNTKEVYELELGEFKNTGVSIEAKIGLIYINDYGYAGEASTWTTNLSSYSGNNWLNDNTNMWTMIRNSKNIYEAYYITDGKIVKSGVTNSYGIKPTFFLKGMVKQVGGTGSLNDPYRLG